jgi:arylformamidase
MTLPYALIDISQWMGDSWFPGNPEFEIRGPFNRVPGSNPEFVYDLVMCSQTGTHIQGPHYFLESGERIHEFPLDCFEGLAFVVDIEKRGCDTTRADLIEKLGDLQLEGKILILRSGNMEEIIAAAAIDPSRRPGLSFDAARYLAEEQKIKMIAIDSIGVESRESKNFEINKYLCERGVLLLEGVVNLTSITAKEVFLEAFPLKIRGIEGTPCRAIVKQPMAL